jgi:hypothetical protein
MKKAFLAGAGGLLVLAGCVAALRGPANPPVETIAGMVPNDLCHICHIPFSEEPLAVSHAKGKVWCQTCHGPSGPHMENEKIGATRPDKVFRGSQVDRMCSRCHERRDHPKVPAGIRATRLAESKKLQTEIKGHPVEPTGVCTDCHGRHWAPTRR